MLAHRWIPGSNLDQQITKNSEFTYYQIYIFNELYLRQNTVVSHYIDHVAGSLRWEYS